MKFYSRSYFCIFYIIIDSDIFFIMQFKNGKLHLFGGKDERGLVDSERKLYDPNVNQLYKEVREETSYEFVKKPLFVADNILEVKVANQGLDDTITFHQQFYAHQVSRDFAKDIDMSDEIPGVAIIRLDQLARVSLESCQGTVQFLINLIKSRKIFKIFNGGLI